MSGIRLRASWRIGGYITAQASVFGKNSETCRAIAPTSAVRRPPRSASSLRMDDWRVVGSVRPRRAQAYTLEEVARHAHKDDCWIVVNDTVYDMTPHVANHEGWQASGKVSTLLAILSAMGTDCTDDFVEVHDARGMRELAAYQIGVLDRPNKSEDRRVRFKTWEELQLSGAVSSRCDSCGV